MARLLSEREEGAGSGFQPDTCFGYSGYLAAIKILAGAWSASPAGIISASARAGPSIPAVHFFRLAFENM